jgi:hypothetical protein
VKDLRPVFRGLVREATDVRADRALGAGAARYPVLQQFRRAREVQERLASNEPVHILERPSLLDAILGLYAETRDRCWRSFLIIAYWRGLVALRRRISRKANREERTALILEVFLEHAEHAIGPHHLWLDTRRDVIRALRDEQAKRRAQSQLVKDALALNLQDVVAHLEEGDVLHEDHELRRQAIVEDLIAQGEKGRDAEAYALFEVYGESAEDTAREFYPDDDRRLQVERAIRRARSRIKKRRLPGGAPQLLLPVVSHRTAFSSPSFERLF